MRLKHSSGSKYIPIKQSSMIELLLETYLGWNK